MRLQKDNVQRVVESEVMIDQMIRDGWIEVEVEKLKKPKKDKGEE